MEWGDVPKAVSLHEFNKRFKVAISQFGLLSPCFLKGAEVDFYKLFILVEDIKRRSGGSFDYTSNAAEWRNIGRVMECGGDYNVMILEGIYNKYIRDSYFKCSPDGVVPIAPRPTTVTPQQRANQTRTYNKRKSAVQSYVPKRQYIKRDPNRWGTVLTPRDTVQRRAPKAENKLQMQQKQYARMREERSRNEVPVPVGEPDRYTMQPIILSLESELPNEVAFALNSLLLLSKTWAVPLPKYPKLLGVLLAHTGAAPVDSSYYKYWDDTRSREFWSSLQEEEQLFNEDYSTEKTKAVQISVIFSNMCNVPTNAVFLSKRLAFINYLLQAVKGSNTSIKNNALVTWTFLACEISLTDAALYSTASEILQLATSSLTSPDRFIILTGLEMVANLCLNEHNAITIEETLQKDHYSLIIRTLLIPDVQILHSVLEAMYSLTSLGPVLCQQFLDVPHCVATLIALFSCKAESLEHGGVKVIKYYRKDEQERVTELTTDYSANNYSSNYSGNNNNYSSKNNNYGNNNYGSTSNNSTDRSLNAALTANTAKLESIRSEKSRRPYNKSSYNKGSPLVRKYNDGDIEQVPLMRPSSPPFNPNVKMSNGAVFAKQWVLEKLTFENSSILLKSAIYNEYCKAAGRKVGTDVLSNKLFMKLIFALFPRVKKAKMWIGQAPQFVYQHLDWVKIPSLGTMNAADNPNVIKVGHNRPNNNNRQGPNNKRPINKPPVNIRPKQVPSQQSHPYRPAPPPAIVNKSNIKTYTKRKPDQDMEMYRKATKLCLNGDGTPPQTPEKENPNITPTKTPNKEERERSCSPVFEFAPSNPIKFIMPKVSMSQQGQLITPLVLSTAPATTSSTTVYNAPVVCSKELSLPSSVQCTLTPAGTLISSPSKSSPSKQYIIQTDDKGYRSPIKILSEVQSNQLLHSDQSNPVYLNNGGQNILLNGGQSKLLMNSSGGGYTFLASPSKQGAQNYTLVQAGHEELYSLPNQGNQVVLAYTKKKTLAKIAPMPNNYGVTTNSPAKASAPAEQRKRRMKPPQRKTSHPCHWEACLCDFTTEAALGDHLMLHVTEHPHACLWVTCLEPDHTRSKDSLIFHLQKIHAKAPKLQSLPECTYSREKVLKYLTTAEPWLDESESPITRSLRLLIILILRNLVTHAPECCIHLEQFEERLAFLAVSTLEPNAICCDVLNLSYSTFDPMLQKQVEEYLFPNR